jgi:hypothetical protein
MQMQIQDLDKKEAESIADIVTSKQIVELNDRMANLSTTLHDENIQAIERTRQRLKSKVKLSEELGGTDLGAIQKEILDAGMSDAAMDEFSKMLVESDMKEREQSRPHIERQM